MAALWGRYLKLLHRYPWRMQATNTCILFGTGDVIAQIALERRNLAKYDIKRTARFFGVGLCVFGPAMQFWYSRLDMFIKGGRQVAVMKKVACDQMFFLPLYIASFIAIMAALRREPPKTMKAKVERDLGPLLVTSWQLWPAIQVVNFYFVPLHHRILLMNAVSLLWNTYLGWKAEELLSVTPRKN